jgi:membrane protease YdiL (CAAX protease family)
MHAGTNVIVLRDPGSPPPEVGAPGERPRVKPIRIYPDRYRVEAGRRGGVLTCTESPTLRVHIERGLSITAAEARTFPAGTIFLDGAAQGAPFMAPEKAIYNLDHHEGCVRSFTLATCEQAMVLIRKRLDLRRRDWTVYANDADLDTVLAIWVLLNHLRLVHENPEICSDVMPLLRLEGVIDAHGIEMQDFCALPAMQLAEARSQMDKLLAPERKLKAQGKWDGVDLARFVAQQLRAIDRMVYSQELLATAGPAIEEVARTELHAGSIAVACRSELGVYEVEKQLRRLHGDRLGLFALQKGSGTYTLRQVDPALPTRLDEIYAQLNLVDPGSGGCVASNRWGGSDEIGGSPRGARTRMTPQQILDACRQAQRRSSWRARLLALLGGSSAAALLVVAALLPVIAPRWFEVAFRPLGTAPHPVILMGSLLLVVAGGLLVLLGRRLPGLYGHRSPTGQRGWAALPLALLGAACGGLWLPAHPFADMGAPLPVAWAVLALLALPLGVELVFRGVVHGILASGFRIQRADGPWRLSVPTLVSSLLYAGCLALPWGSTWEPLPQLERLAGPDVALSMAGALIFGAAAGIARERAESVAAAVLLHWVSLAALLALAI